MIEFLICTQAGIPPISATAIMENLRDCILLDLGRGPVDADRVRIAAWTSSTFAISQGQQAE